MVVAAVVVVVVVVGGTIPTFFPKFYKVYATETERSTHSNK